MFANLIRTSLCAFLILPTTAVAQSGSQSPFIAGETTEPEGLSARQADVGGRNAGAISHASSSSASRNRAGRTGTTSSSVVRPGKDSPAVTHGENMGIGRGDTFTSGASHDARGTTGISGTGSAR